MEKSQIQKAVKDSRARKTKGLSYGGSSSKATGHLIQEWSKEKWVEKRGRSSKDGMKTAEVAASTSVAQFAAEKRNLKAKSLWQNENTLPGLGDRYLKLHCFDFGAGWGKKAEEHRRALRGCSTVRLGTALDTNTLQQKILSLSNFQSNTDAFPYPYC